MTSNATLLAWIEPRDGNEYVAAFVGAGAAGSRGPAQRLCASADEARRWVESEASACGLPVEWVNRAKTR